MNIKSQELQAIRVRVEKLELENARLKRIGAVVVLVGSIVLLMGQAKLPAAKQTDVGWEKRVIRAGTIKANRIELVTPNNDLRAELDAVLDGSALRMFDKDGKAFLLLSSRIIADPNAPLYQKGLNILDSSDKQIVWLGPAFSGGSMLVLGDANGHEDISLSAKSSEARINLVADSPTLSLGRSSGYQAVIGTTDLVTPSTGETHQTSAASVVLLNDRGNVIWSAPQ